MCPISKTQKILNSILGTSFGPCAFAGVQEGTILNRGAMWLWTAFSWIHCTTCHLGLRILLGTRFGVPRKCCYACQRSANAIGVLSASNIFRSVVSRTQNLWGKDWQPWATERMCPKLSSLEWRIWWLPFFSTTRTPQVSPYMSLQVRFISHSWCILQTIPAAGFKPTHSSPFSAFRKPPRDVVILKWVGRTVKSF